MKISTLFFSKTEFLPSKKHLLFLAMEGDGIELTNIKVKENHFYWCFEIFMVLAQNTESAKHFQAQHFIVYGNKHSLTKNLVLGQFFNSP